MMHLTPARRDQLVTEMAATLQRRGWAPLAAWLLPAAGPLTWLAGQALWLAQPALSAWLDPARLADWALLLEEPDIGGKLALHLEQTKDEGRMTNDLRRSSSVVRRDEGRL